MVGQRFVSLLDGHPWFDLTVVAASSRSAVKHTRKPSKAAGLCRFPCRNAPGSWVVKSAEKDIRAISDDVDFVFSAVDMKKDEIRALEEAYAKAECPVISNNSAHRWTPDVPMVVPELNPEHIRVIGSQRKRLGTARGFIAVKSNCSIQSYVPALHPLKDEFGLSKVLVCTYQAISGAGKTFETWPEYARQCLSLISAARRRSPNASR